MSKILGILSDEELKKILADHYALSKGYVGLSEENIEFTISLEHGVVSFIVSVTDV